jgi:glyoxylate/hydroxypyruvate reductase A
MLYVELPLTSSHRQRLRTIVGDTAVWFADPDARSGDDRGALARSEVAFGNCDPTWLAQSGALRWLQLASVGVDGYLGVGQRQIAEPLTVTNLSGLFADPVAETCVAGVLAALRGIDQVVIAKGHRRWVKSDVRPRLRLLAGSRVLVLGTGAMGRRLVDLLRPFGCELTTYGRSSGDLRTIEQLESALPDTDVLVGMLPGTPETAGLLDGRRLAMLPPGAVVANLGRGSLIDEKALVTALHAGSLGGAVLDVTAAEPLPDGDALWAAPNVILTQHTAGGTTDELARAIDVFADNWDRFRAGRDLRNVVRWARGY